MRRQTIKPNQNNQVEMMKQYGMLSTASLMQKVGKGKRRCDLKLSKSSKKMLGRIAKELKKQIVGQVPDKTSGINLFLSYLESESKNKSKKILKISFDELDFLKKTISGSVKEIDKMKMKWYSFLKKIAIRLTMKQYKYLLEELKK